MKTVIYKCDKCGAEFREISYDKYGNYDSLPEIDLCGLCFNYYNRTFREPLSALHEERQKWLSERSTQ